MELKRVRGVRDILPENVSKYSYVFERFTKVIKKFGFKEVFLPTIENFQLYNHTLGDTTEVVNKQMFEITPRLDETKERMVLRPEGTAGMVRMFVENNFKDKYPIKRFYYFGSMFRYERPQKGRYREFYQYGLEIFGETPVVSDFFLIFIINNMLDSIGIKYDIEINSIGCSNCRENLILFLKKYFKDKKDNLCELCQQRIERNPLRILDCKIDSKKFYNEEIDIKKFLCDSCKKDFEETAKLLDIMNIKYKISPTLVRGLDYYNGFVFEYKTSFLEAAQNTICAGGRYDNLIKKYDRQTEFACGAAFGVDRIVEILGGKEYDVKESTKIGIAIVNDSFLTNAIQILNQLSQINNNIIIIGPFYKKSLKSQLRLLNNDSCKYVLIIGEETRSNKVIIKNFQTNTQQEVYIDELKSFIYKNI